MSDLYIYGAGLFGRFMYSYAKLNGFCERVKGFIVTGADGNGAVLFDKPVYTFKYYAENLHTPQNLIIVAVNEKKNSDMIEKLKSAGISNYAELHDEVCMKMAAGMVERYKNVPVQKNKVFMECFHGRYYGCNPKYITEELIRRREKLDIVWCTDGEPGKSFPDEVRTVGKFSPEYFEELFTSSVYVSNGFDTMFNLKREETFHIDTWHGSGPFKKCGRDAARDDTVFSRDGMAQETTDVILAACVCNMDFFRSAYGCKAEVLPTGYPRNDIFFRNNADVVKKIRDMYDVPEGNRIVLYAPTFRIKNPEATYAGYGVDMERVTAALEKRFGCRFTYMFRAHHTLKKYLETRGRYINAIDASYYEDTQELLAAADVLIGDYSSIMWDFGLQKKPVFLYHGDIDEYMDDRGLYSSPSTWPYRIGHSNDELVEQILSFDEDKYRADIDAFYTKWTSYDDGHASERVADIVMEAVRKN